MVEPLDWQLLQEAERRALQEILDTVQTLTEINVGPNGETFGSTQMSREDRILMFLEDARSGAVDALGTINPKFQMAYIRQYQRDVRNSPVLRMPDQEVLSAPFGVTSG